MPRRLPAGERDRRLAEEVLYLHSLWRRGGPAPASAAAPAPAPIQPRSDRREVRERIRLAHALRRQERERIRLAGALRRKERKLLRRRERKRLRREIDHAAAGAASAPSTANPPPPATPPGPSSVDFTNRDPADVDGEGFDSDGDKAEEREAAVYFSGLFERDAGLRGHYTGSWREGQFQCMVCAAGSSAKVGKAKAVRRAVRRFHGCLALVHHARDASRGLSRHGRRGAHRALAAVVCRLLGWDIDNLAPPPRLVIDPPTTAGVQHAEENDGAGEDDGSSTDDHSYSIDGSSTDDDSYSIDEDGETEDEESVDEEDIEIGMPDSATDGDEEDSEIESDEEYAEDADTGAEGSRITDGDTEAIELDNSEKTPEKESDIARKRDMKIRDRLLSLIHAKPVVTTPKKTEVQKRSHVPEHKEVPIPGIHFNEGSDKAKRKASAFSYQGMKSIASGAVKKVKVNKQPGNKGKQSETNESGASARKAKRPAVAARKAKLLAKKQLAKKQLAKNSREYTQEQKCSHS